jgi:glutamate synthase (NADPH/NADH) large chain
MTGGCIVVLGPTGLNFGAGMTGGFAFVLDEDGAFADRYNHELVDIHRIQPEHMAPHREYLRGLIQSYVHETRSAWGRRVLHHFDSLLPRFWLVKPKATEIATLINTLERAA